MSPLSYEKCSCFIRHGRQQIFRPRGRKRLRCRLIKNGKMLDSGHSQESFAGSGARDPTSVGPFIATLPEGSERSNLRGVFIQELIRSKQTEAAKSYAFGLPEGAERRTTLEQTGLELMYAGSDIAQFVEGFSPEDRTHLTDFRTFFQKWMSVDPKHASAVLLENAPNNAAAAADASKLRRIRGLLGVKQRSACSN